MDVIQPNHFFNPLLSDKEGSRGGSEGSDKREKLSKRKRHQVSLCEKKRKKPANEVGDREKQGSQLVKHLPKSSNRALSLTCVKGFTVTACTTLAYAHSLVGIALRSGLALKGTAMYSLPSSQTGLGFQQSTRPCCSEPEITPIKNATAHHIIHQNFKDLLLGQHFCSTL